MTKSDSETNSTSNSNSSSASSNQEKCTDDGGHDEKNMVAKNRKTKKKNANTSKRPHEEKELPENQFGVSEQSTTSMKNRNHYKSDKNKLERQQLSSSESSSSSSSDSSTSSATSSDGEISTSCSSSSDSEEDDGLTKSQKFDLSKKSQNKSFNESILENQREGNDGATIDKKNIKEAYKQVRKENKSNEELNVISSVVIRKEDNFNVEKGSGKPEQELEKKNFTPNAVDSKVVETRYCKRFAKSRSQSPQNIKSKQSQRSRSRNRSSKRPSRSRSESRSRSRSLSRNKHRREYRRSNSIHYDKRRYRRSESLERRREERRKRHAERAEQEKAKRSKIDKENLELREKELNKPNGDPDKVNELDNTTVTDPKARITERQRKTVDLLTSRTGGAYIPPAKLRLMQAEITDKASAAYQRIAWEALKKSIHGYINKVNVDNIAIITRELLRENIVRGRGLLCRSIIQAQAASPTFTHVYAALVSIINSKFPNIGELLLKRLVIQFKRAYRRSDKPVCLSSSRFIAHLVNQRVAHEILALEILTLLVESPTDDSVEVAIAFLKECGMKLTEVSSKGIGAIFEMLKNILHEGKLDKRVQYMIEVVFQVRKDGFKDHQSVIESLELVEEDDQFTHLLMLDDATNTEDILNAFKFDEEYASNEDKYKDLCKEILGSDVSESEGSSSVGNRSETDSSDSDNEEGEGKPSAEEIIDNTETNLIALRRTIYLTINSSLDYEECAHKLMKMQLKPGQEIELCHMFLDCCAEQRTYEKFYGLLAQRFCSINKIYIEPFEEIFRDTYQTTHRLDTNRLRNVSKFFAHLLFTDAISWDVFECIKLNEDDTTSSSRIFIKILFQELAEYMGLSQLNKKLKDDVLLESLAGVFPKDNPRNTRFSINFFTSIGLGGLTDELRQFLKNAPKSVPPINAEILANKPINSKSSSSSSSSSEPSSTSSSSSSSASDKKKRKRKTKRVNKKKKLPSKTKIKDKTKKVNKKRKKSKIYEEH